MVTSLGFYKPLLPTFVPPKQVPSYPPDSLEARITARAKRTLSTNSQEESFSLKKPLLAYHRPLHHVDLVKIISALYKRKNINGLCNGLAVAGIEAALAGKIHLFKMQLNKLEILFSIQLLNMVV